MRKKLTAMFLSFCMVSVFMPQAVLADDVLESGDLLTDGEDVSSGAVTELAEEIAKRTEKEVRKMQEEKAAAEEAAREAEEKRKAEEARKKAEEARRKAEEDRVAKRQEIVNYALQFEGNPYVYGGTSLTNGADCSGFTMAVMSHFGVSLPHHSGSQANAGRAVSSSEMRPGDLVFYTNSGGTINHVALYIGNGQVVHASNPSSGIKISRWNYRTPAKIVNVLGD